MPVGGSATEHFRSMTLSARHFRHNRGMAGPDDGEQKHPLLHRQNHRTFIFRAGC